MPLHLHGFADFANYQLPEIGLSQNTAPQTANLEEGARNGGSCFNLQAKGDCPDHLGPMPPPFSLKPF
jgi:hypothetical protein